MTIHQKSPPTHPIKRIRAREFFAGTASCEITPRIGCWLIGSEGPSSGVHDPLLARVLVLNDGAQACAILGLDIVGLTVEFSRELRELIKRRTGITTSLINCSHTHNAPFSMPWSVDGWQRFCRDEVEWQDRLRHALPELVESALCNCRPASLRSGRAPVQVGLNRRTFGDDGIVMVPNPEGDCLPWVDALYVSDAHGQPLALLFSHAAHPVIVHGASTLISADYCESAVAAIQNELGEHVEPLFLQGCGADINGDPLQGGFERAAEAGARLGAAALLAIESSVPIEGAAIQVESQSLRLACQPLPRMQDCEQAIEEYKQGLADSNTSTEDFGKQDKLRRLESLKAMIASGNQPEVDFEIISITIGSSWSLIAMPHEVFSAYALWIEEHSPVPHPMTLAYTNGCEIYIPTDEDLALGVHGGYEAACFPVPGAAAMAYRNRLALQPGVEQRVKNAIRDLWARHHDPAR